MSSGLSVQYEDRVLRLTLSHPEKSNAFGPVEAEALMRALRQASKAEALIFTSQRSRFFCAGGDMQYYSSLKSRAKGLLANRKIALALKSLARFPAPTLAYVNGDCLGGGLELLGAFDEVWCAPHVRFGFWQRRIGLSFGWGGFDLLSERLKAADLRRLSINAVDLSAFEARDLGLADRIVALDSWEGFATDWAARTVALPRAPLKVLKSATAATEAKSFSTLWGKSEHAQALADFSQRRKSPK